MKYNLTNSKKLSLSEKRSQWEVFKHILTYIALIAIPATMVLWICFNTTLRFPVTVFSEGFRDFLTYFSGFLLISNILFILYMLVLTYWKYKEVDTVTDCDLPHCVVIIPAYNEGKHVLSSLNSILESDYPLDKLELVAVDDGSKDDTWEYIRIAAEKSNGRIKPIKQPFNQGKRAAIHAGIKASSGDIIVTIDSDSVISKDTLKRLVSPFVNNPKVGGVAGNVRVLNIEEGIIPKMLEVNFLFSFEFMRSAQSAFRGVFCSPGALSSFRRSVIMEFLEEWVNQKFMGKPANIGEDRAMTNLILKAGYDMVFQKNAIVHTIVPTTYRGLCKMLTRWGRSNVRENFAMIGFVFNKFDLSSFKLVSMQISLIMQLVWMIVPLFTAFIYVYCMIATLGMFFFTVAPVAILFAILPAIMYLHRCRNANALLAYIYSIFYFTTLFWIAPYSILSFHRSGWLTRNNSADTNKN